MVEIKLSYDMDLSEPDEKLLAYAKENINEDKSTKDQILGDFKALIQEKGEWKSSRLDDSFLLRFLRAKSFDIKDAYHSLVNYQEYKKKYPKYYTNIQFDRMRKIGDDNLIGTQPFHDADGRRIVFYRMGNWNPDTVSVRELFQCSILFAELGILEQRSQILGVIVIFDLGGIKMTHVKHLTPKIAGRIFDAVVHTYPLRVHAVHVVNETPVFKAGYSIAKPFLDKEMKKRIFFHNTDMASLHQHIDPKYLPESYGGVHPDYGYGRWITHLLGNQVAIDELKNLGYDYLEGQVRNLGEY